MKRTRCKTCYYQDASGGCEGYGMNKDCGAYKPLDRPNIPIKKWQKGEPLIDYNG